MSSHDAYKKDILKQLTRIANSLDKIEKKLPNASKIYFEENILGGLFVGYRDYDKMNLNADPNDKKLVHVRVNNNI